MSTRKKFRAMNKFSVIILGAGIGKRMYSKTPKVLHKILGRPLISFIIGKINAIKCDEIIAVIGKNTKSIKKELGKTVRYAVQPIPLGTGDAARKGIEIATCTNVLILNGDIPLLSEHTLRGLIDHHQQEKAHLTILTCLMKNPFGYGRILKDKRGRVSGIIEDTDATPKQQRVNEINVGAYCGNKQMILSALDDIKPQNQQGELYLTDIVKELYNQRKRIVGFRIYDEDEMMGINSQSDLTRARQIIKTRWFNELMSQGVSIEDPTSTDIDLSVKVGKFVNIRPHTLIEGKTKIKDGTTVGPFTWIVDGKKRAVKLNVR